MVFDETFYGGLDIDETILNDSDHEFCRVVASGGLLIGAVPPPEKFFAPTEYLGLDGDLSCCRYSWLEASVFESASEIEKIKKDRTLRVAERVAERALEKKDRVAERALETAIVFIHSQ